MHSLFLRLACLAAAASWAGSQPVALAQDANRDAAVTVSNARDIVNRLADRTGSFKEELDQAVEHSTMGGGEKDKAKKSAENLHEAAKKLRDVFHDKKDKNNPEVRDRVDKTLAAAADVNRVMAGRRFTDKLHTDWEMLRSDLNALAQIYTLSPI
jgi:gas vesicle protein